MSQADPAPPARKSALVCGGRRARLLLLGMTSIAALSGASAIVRVGPPLSSSGTSSGSCPTMLLFADENPQVLGDVSSRL